MARFKRFALRRPILFGFSLLVIYIVVGILVYPVHFLFADDDVGQLYGDSVSKAIVFFAFLLILWRFGWLQSSGIARLGTMGNKWTWPIVGGLAIYKVLIEVYAFTDNLRVELPTSSINIAKAIYYFPASLVEETMIRGLILVAMTVAWGATKRGVVKGVVISSVMFGLFHLLNVLANPVDMVVLQVMVAVLTGIFYAALVLKFRSLWPAILLHWLTNAAVNIKITDIENYQDTSSMWNTFALLLIPILVFSAYLVWSLPSQDSIRLTLVDGDSSEKQQEHLRATA